MIPNFDRIHSPQSLNGNSFWSLGENLEGEKQEFTSKRLNLRGKVCSASRAIFGRLTAPLFFGWGASEMSNWR